VRVPEEAGSGRAKVTFCLDNWKGANVYRSTIEIPIEEAEGKIEE
jgi:hypothetical protein